MDFCKACDNTTTLSLDDETSPLSVVRKCLACGSRSPVPHGCHVLFERLGTTVASETYKQFINDDMFVDPTIAMLDAECPHCDIVRRIKYVKFGPGLDYVYACSTCESFWTRKRGGKAEIVRGPTKSSARG
jgi:hypothetical protein